jgi:DNA-binding MarR family transcriptional regulator
MSDVNTGPNPLFLREDQLHQAMELLFYAYRDFTAECDAILATHGFGRAHHRVIYFVGRYPALSVSELLGILRITKQSLSRVLGELIETGFVSSRPSPKDKRRRMLELTAAGHELERRLSAVQRACIARAYREAGGEAVSGFRKVLLGIINGDDRKRFEQGG